MATILPITKASSDILKVEDFLDNQLAQLGKSAKDFIISRSDLKLMVLADANTDKYDFYVKEGKGTTLPGEMRLSQNDLAFVSQIGLNLQIQDLSTTPKEYANRPLSTFPDANLFTAAEAKALQTVYNGKLTFSTSVTTRVPAIATHHFRYAPEAQVIESAFVGITNATADGYGPTDAARGYYDLGKLYGMDGAEDNKITLTLGEGLRTSISGAGNNTIVFVLNMQVILVSEGARKVDQYLSNQPWI